MKKLLSVFVLCFPMISLAGNNDIYLTQTGTGLTLTIDQIGATNTIGTSQARAEISGASMTVDLDQIGDSNIIAASILQAGSSSWTYKATGDSNTATFTVGGTGDVAGSDFDYDAAGASNVLVFTQGDAATATTGNQDFDIDGTSNNVNVKCNVVGCVNNWTIAGNSSDVDTTQAGSADSNITGTLTGNSSELTITQAGDKKNLTATVTGASNDIDVTQSGKEHTIAMTYTGSNMNIDIDQTDTVSSNVANLLLQSSGGSGSSINIDQCASGC